MRNNLRLRLIQALRKPAISLRATRDRFQSSDMSAIMSTSSSPPSKRLKHDGMPTEDAPVKALFTSTAFPAAGPSKPPAKPDKRRRKTRHILPDRYSAADVLWQDVHDFLGPSYVDAVLAKHDDAEWTPPSGLELFSTVELRVGAFTVSGESDVCRIGADTQARL